MTLDIITISLVAGLIFFSGIWYYLFKTETRKEYHLSLILLIIFLLLRLIVHFTSDIKPAISLYAEVTSLLILTLALIRIFVKVFIENFLIKQENINIPKILQDLLQICAFLVIAVIILREYFRIDTSILVTSSVISIVIGLALQDTLGNFFSGLAIQMQKPFEKGDWIMFNSQLGQVTDIDWRAIRIRTLELDYFVIPNSEIAKSSFINYSKPTKLHRINIPMGVSYKSPPNFVKKVIMDILNEEPDILKHPKPNIILTNYNDFSIDYEIRVYTENFVKFREITDSIYTKIWYQFKRNNISIPFPIRDVYMHEVKEGESSESTKKIIDLLKTVDFLTPLSEPEFEILSKSITIQHYAAKEVIIRQKETDDTFYIIDKGEVEVKHSDDNGNITLMKILKPPSFFGELSLLTGSERTASVSALTDCRLITINAESFRSIIMANPKIGTQISNIITSRQLELEETYKNKSSEEILSEIENRSSNLLNRMKNFFGFNQN